MKRNPVNFIIFYVAVVLLTVLASFAFAVMDVTPAVQAAPMRGNPSTATSTHTYTSTPTTPHHAPVNPLIPTSTPVPVFS